MYVKVKHRKVAYQLVMLLASFIILVTQILVLSCKHAESHVRHLELDRQNSAVPDHLQRQQEYILKDSIPVAHRNVPLARHQSELRDDSSDATVMAMAQGYKLDVHRRFVGSLRKSGFKGSIMLATEPVLKEGVEAYLVKQNVTILRLNYTACVHKILDEHEVKSKKDKECNTCIAPYQNVKIRWGRFPFLRDALINCKKCTGPVLVTDVRDTLFQRDPFGDGAPQIEGLHLYGEHRANHAGHWFIRKPIDECTGVVLSGTMGPMLCSGTTIGSRDTMIGYLDTMYEEMVRWMDDKKCWSKKAGGDQAIHNYLYYTGQFDHLSPKVFWPREDIVNTVGARGVAFSKYHGSNHKGQKNIHNIPYTNSDPKKGMWLPIEFDLTDEEGYFIDNNGERSRVVHQYDRFGVHVEKWLDQNERIIWE
jgi:hypothetical protein